MESVRYARVLHWPELRMLGYGGGITARSRHPCRTFSVHPDKLWLLSDKFRYYRSAGPTQATPAGERALYSHQHTRIRHIPRRDRRTR